MSESINCVLEANKTEHAAQSYAAGKGQKIEMSRIFLILETRNNAKQC